MINLKNLFNKKTRVYEEDKEDENKKEKEQQ